MVDQKVRNKDLDGIKPRRTCAEMHHLFFADESLFFIKFTVDNAQALKHTVDQYSKGSGHKVNFAKPTIFSVHGANSQISLEVAEVFGMSLAKNAGKYLGLPSLWGRSKVSGPDLSKR